MPPRVTGGRGKDIISSSSAEGEIVDVVDGVDDIVITDIVVTSRVDVPESIEIVTGSPESIEIVFRIGEECL